MIDSDPRPPQQLSRDQRLEAALLDVLRDGAWRSATALLEAMRPRIATSESILVPLLSVLTRAGVVEEQRSTSRGWRSWRLTPSIVDEKQSNRDW